MAVLGHMRATSLCCSRYDHGASSRACAVGEFLRVWIAHRVVGFSSSPLRPMRHGRYTSKRHGPKDLRHPRALIWATVSTTLYPIFTTSRSLGPGDPSRVFPNIRLNSSYPSAQPCIGTGSVRKTPRRDCVSILLQPQLTSGTKHSHTHGRSSSP